MTRFLVSIGVSTPQSFLIDMATTGDVLLTPIGFNDDIDGDGISNDDEINSLAGSDANQDQISDHLQGNVASIETVGGPVTLISNAGTVLGSITAQDATSTTNIEGDFPLGRISFSVQGLPQGASATVDLKTPGDAAINLIYTVNETPDPFFAEYGDSNDEAIEFLGDRIQLTGRDGGEADQDGEANGRLNFALQPASVDSIWTNPVNSSDVSGDGETTAFDALLVINALQLSNGTYELKGIRPANANFLDANADGRVSALDALQVINKIRLNLTTRFVDSEGELVPPSVLAIKPPSLQAFDEDERDETAPESRLF